MFFSVKQALCTSEAWQERRRQAVKIVHEVIEEQKPHRWLAKRQSRYNPYTGSVLFDYSGAVEPIENAMDLLMLIREEQVTTPWGLFRSLHTGTWVPGHDPHCERYWQTYEDLLSGALRIWLDRTHASRDESGQFVDREKEAAYEKDLSDLYDCIASMDLKRLIARVEDSLWSCPADGAPMTADVHSPPRGSR